tara:strand:- start:804 stop:1544 length:741 start_codon:yes stop_codon:yes gene_type:complete
MANKKFSQFVSTINPDDVDFLVGYKDLDNMQIPTDKVGVFYELDANGVGTNEVDIELIGSDGSVSDLTLLGGSGILIEEAAGEIKISRERGALFSVVGIWKNLFGGDPGIFGDTLEFAASASPVAANSSVFQVPFDCKLVSISTKWIHNSALNIALVNSTWDVSIRTMINNQGSATQTTNYSATATVLPGLTLTQADNGTFPNKTYTGAPIIFTAGDIINISGVENGGIGTDDAEMEAYLIFEQLI